jgi:hypothetical protein
MRERKKEEGEIDLDKEELKRNELAGKLKIEADCW